MTNIVFKNSLFKRTFLPIASSLMVVVTLFGVSLGEKQRVSLIDVMHSKTITVARSMSLISADAMVLEDYSFIIEHIRKVLIDDSEIVYVVINKRDGLNIYSDVESWNLMDKLPLPITKMNTSIVQGEILKSSLNEEEVYHLSYPVVFSGIEWGWVSIGFSLDKYNVGMRVIYRDSILLLIATLFASILFSLVLTRWFVKPILTLNAAAKKIASGDFNVQVGIKSDDELGELSNSFNHMIAELKTSDEQLRSYNIELERRVNERTEALNSLNRELDKRVKDEVLKRGEQEQMLIQQSRFAAMGEMIGNIAHQWRQPLNALGLLLQNIENAYDMEFMDKEFIERTVEKGTMLTGTMSKTIDDFRNFFKPNKEQEVFSVSSSFETTMEIISSGLKNNNIEIVREIDENVCIKGFPSEFSQVLLNLINNAKDALIDNIKENRKIYIYVFSDQELAYIDIKDNAGGVPGEIIEKIFDPYFTTKDEGKGTGIGLYMSKTIIENNMNGRLSVQNEEDGATFRVNAKLVNCQNRQTEQGGIR